MIGQQVHPIQEPFETAELITFTHVVDAKSLARAAAKLGVPRTTVGRRLARLEERLGTRLLRRTTRSLSLTDAGQSFYRHARIVLDAIVSAEASVRMADSVMRGDVRVSIPPPIDQAFIAMVAAFAKRYPDVRIQVDATTRIVDLHRDGYDVAVRATADMHPGLVARTIGRHKVIAVASPAYLAEYGTPRTVKDLRKHRCLSGFARGELPLSTWPLVRGTVHVESPLSSNDIQLLREAAVRGLGIALVPDVIVDEALSKGTLVRVLPGVVEGENHLAIVYAEREFLPLHVRAFIEALLEWAPTLLGASRKKVPAASRQR